MLAGKRYLIMGIANEFSLTYAIAEGLHRAGAKLAFTHLPDVGERPKNRDRLFRLVAKWDPVFMQACDVTIPEHWQHLEVALRQHGLWDGAVHGVAGAPYPEVLQPLWQTSAESLMQSMNVSVASLIALCRVLRPSLNIKSSVVTLSYVGATKVMPGYQLMGVCKAALEAAVRYLAYEGAVDGMRVNAISAPPLKTLSASALPGFELGEMWHQLMTPDGTKVTVEPVVNAAEWLLGAGSSATTGCVLPVLGGFDIMGAPNPLLTESLQLGKIPKMNL